MYGTLTFGDAKAVLFQNLAQLRNRKFAIVAAVDIALVAVKEVVPIDHKGKVYQSNGIRRGQEQFATWL